MSLNYQMVLIQCQIFTIILIIIKEHETLTTIPPINAYVNRINNRLVFKTKKLIDKTKNGENVPSLEVVEVVLVQCNLIDNSYQQKSEVLYTFLQNKSYVYLLNVEPSNLLFLKNYNAESNEIIITVTDQNVRPLEIEGKVNFTLLINK